MKGRRRNNRQKETTAKHNGHHRTKRERVAVVLALSSFHVLYVARAKEGECRKFPPLFFYYYLAGTHV